MMDININVRFMADDDFLQGVLALTQALQSMEKAQSWMAYTKAASMGLVKPKPVEQQTQAQPKAEKPKQASAIKAGQAVGPAQERAINDMLSVPSQKELAESADETLPESELAQIRPKVAAFLKSHEDGKQKLKEWLTAHDAERVTKVKVKDKDALLAFIAPKEAA